MTQDKKLHILLVRFSSLGDIILSTSVISAIKERWRENVTLSFLTSRPFVPLLEHHKDLRKVYGHSRTGGISGLNELVKIFKEINQDQKVDLILDLHGTIRSLFLRFFTIKVPSISIDKRTVERSILTFFKFDCLSRQREKDSVNPLVTQRRGTPLLWRNISDFNGLFGFSQQDKIKQYIKDECVLNLPTLEHVPLSSCSISYHKYDNFEIEKWTKVPLSIGSYICIIPSASFEEKRWPIKNFKNLMEMLFKHPYFQENAFIILAGPEDNFCDEFNIFKERYPKRFFNLQGKTSLVESTLILKNALFCIGNDTGLPHLSESVGRPSVVILGPTGEEFGFYPHLKNSDVVLRRIWCRPCTTNGKGRCIRKERYCLTEITEEMVLNKMIRTKQRCL